MDQLPSEARRRAARLAGGATSLIAQPIGHGVDGVVFASSYGSAIKIHRRADLYHQEVNAYLRLREHDVRSLCEHNVPVLLRHSDGLRAIEMTLVQPPFVLDFAKTMLDDQPDFTEEKLAYWREEVAERFGAHESMVWAIHHVLWSRYGIYYHDLSVNNIRFAEDSEC